MALLSKIDPTDLVLTDTYVFSAWLKADEVDDFIEIQIKYQDASGWHEDTR